MTTPSVPKDAELRVIRPENEATQTDFALALQLKLTNEKSWLEEWRKTEPRVPSYEEWLKANHRLSLMNPDGQKAVLSFTMKPRA